MSEFCKQCAESLFGPDPYFNDAKGLLTKKREDAGFRTTFLCEGCGPTWVDSTGACVSGTPWAEATQTSEKFVCANPSHSH